MFCESSKSLESRIRAASRMNAGEEITISYVPQTGDNLFVVAIFVKITLKMKKNLRSMNCFKEQNK
jgi:hypothetical protein